MRCLFTGFILVACGCVSLWAQETAQISGIVTDQSGAVLPGVEISATQTDTGLIRGVITNETGAYVLPNLPIGPYRLEVALPGFRTYAQTGITLQVGSNPTIDVALQVGQVSETVEVQADAALVETRTTGIGQVIDNTRVLELPLNGRQVTELVLLSGAAVQAPDGRYNPGSRNYPTVVVAVAGGLATGVTYSLDGANHNDPYNNLNLPLSFPDALQEFKVETSGLQAQYGFHSAGAVNAVTKSGTNSFHGSLFEFVRNGSLNARNAFDVRNDGLKRHQFGGTIGGPIIQNRLFFFAAEQGTKERSRPTANRAWIPTPAIMAGDFSTLASPTCNNNRQLTLGAPFVDNQIDPARFSLVAKNLVTHELFPRTSDPCGEFRFGSTPRMDEWITTGRMDYRWTDKHSIFGRYLDARRDTPSDFDGENILTLTNGNQEQRAYSFALGSMYLFSPNVVGSLRGVVNRTRIEKLNPDYFELTDLGAKNVYESIPGMTYLTITNGFNIATSLVNPGHYNSTSWHLGEDLSIVRAAHQFGAGASWIHQIYNGSVGVARSAQPSFDGRFTGHGLADFMLGRASSFSQGQAGISKTRQNSIGLYIQDTWKATPRLTVNAGLRWEPNIGPYTVNWTKHFKREWFDRGVRSTIYKNAPAGLQYPGDALHPDNKMTMNRWLNFAPRVGFAWDAHGDGRMAIRSAYGVFYDIQNMFHWAGAGTGAPYNNQVTYPEPGGGLDDLWRDFPGGNPFPINVTPDAKFPEQMFFVNFDREQPTTYVHQWNLSIQRQFGADLAVSANYVGSSTIHLPVATEGNPAVYLPGSSCVIAGRMYSPCSTMANTNQRRVLFLANPDQGKYYANMSYLENAGTANYHALLLSVQRRGRGLTVQGNYTWGHCISDDFVNAGAQHNAGDYPGRRWYGRGNCVGGGDTRHSFNASTVYQTPEFSNRALRMLAGGWQLSGIVRIQSGGYFDVVSGFNTALTSGNGTNRAHQTMADVYLPNKGIDGWLNRAAFARPANGEYGNVSQNIQGPGVITINMGLTRTFQIRESHSLQFRTEAFNLPNHVNPNNPINNLNNTNFGKILSAKDPRILQLALKYQF
jgi:hypothetical protein